MAISSGRRAITINGQPALLPVGKALPSASGSIRRADDMPGKAALAPGALAIASGPGPETVPAFDKALDSLGSRGGLLRLSAGTYLANAAPGPVLPISAPVSLVGDGPDITAINPVGAGPEDDTIQVSPNTSYDHSGLKLSGFALHDPTNGKRRGRHGVFLATPSAGQQLPLLLIEQVHVGDGRGFGIYHRNDATANPNGGLYGATIRNCALKGGLKLENSGDSINVYDTLLSMQQVGLDIALVAGASGPFVERCNITNSGGAIRHRSGHRPVYRALNIENSQAGVAERNDGALVNISGERGPIVGGSLTDSLVSAFEASNATHLVKLANTRGFVLDRLTLLTGGRRLIAIEIDESCEDTRIGSLSMQDGDRNGDFDLTIIDRGSGTMGIVKQLKPSSGWVEKSPDNGLRFFKAFDGAVTILANVRSGSSADGSLLGTMPPGFRPDAETAFLLLGIAPAGARTGTASIDRNGAIRIAGVQGASELVLNISYPSRRLGHSVSPE